MTLDKVSFNRSAAPRGPASNAPAASNASRLFVVSNRVMLPESTQTGGLAHALSSLFDRRGGTWMGWSGRLSSSLTPKRRSEGDIDYLTWDLSKEEFNGYYRDYANRVLWPLLHGRTDLMAFSPAALQQYLAVNERFADQVAAEVRDQDILWVHDYHLIPLASMLRTRAVQCRIGFFLHTPLPAPHTLVTLPHHRALLGLLAAYDVVGVQTHADALALRSYLCNESGAREQGDLLAVPEGGLVRVAAFPIGIDPDAMQDLATHAQELDEVRDLRQSLVGRELMIGVDRLDYSKGLPQRLRAFGRMLEHNVELSGRASFLQVAPESRREVGEYRRLSREVQRLVGDINGHHSAPDWTPVRYVNRGYPHSVLAGFYRLARVAAVTPLRDGMNLVAKEFLACQAESDPGVLVLSEFAGAAAELGDSALIVNPYDVDGCSQAMSRAYAMGQEERRNRWHTAMRILRRGNVHHWCDEFLAALEEPSVRQIAGLPAASPVVRCGSRRVHESRNPRQSPSWA